MMAFFFGRSSMLAWHTFSFFEIVLVENEVISRCALLLCCCRRRRPHQVGLVNYEVCQARGSDCVFNIFFIRCKLHDTCSTGCVLCGFS